MTSWNGSLMYNRHRAQFAIQLGIYLRGTRARTAVLVAAIRAQKRICHFHIIFLVVVCCWCCCCVENALECASIKGTLGPISGCHVRCVHVRARARTSRNIMGNVNVHTVQRKNINDMILVLVQFRQWFLSCPYCYLLELQRCFPKNNNKL